MTRPHERDADPTHHQALVTFLAKRLSRITGCAVEDAKSEINLWIVEHLHQYDPTIARVSTWYVKHAYMRCLRVLMRQQGYSQGTDRKWHRRGARGYGEDPSAGMGGVEGSGSMRRYKDQREERLYQERVRDFAWAVEHCPSLTDRERTIIQMRAENRNLHDIGVTVRVSKQRVCKIIQEVKAKLTDFVENSR